ncbi:unnamed protein product [Rhizoctonia solani]|uniref:Uncharacterized protein n=1 Tax=Rhizoctonia solani TaxID=456999 RepID=A0A8H3HEF0_9AGAM|nr:unnamed protein product [Rhizoctonia solani]
MTTPSTMDAYDFITMVNELFRSQHASQIAAIILINSLVSFDLRADRVVLSDADREAVLSLSQEFLYLAAHLHVEINFAPALGIPEQVLRDAYGFGLDLKHMCKNPKQSSRGRMMEAHTLLCYAAIVRHFHSQLTDWDLSQIKDTFQKDRGAHRSINRTCGVGARRKRTGQRIVDACLRSAHIRTSSSTATSMSTGTSVSANTMATFTTNTSATTQTISSKASSRHLYTVNEQHEPAPRPSLSKARAARSATNAQWI